MQKLKNYNIVAKVTEYGKIDYKFRVLKYIEDVKSKSDCQEHLMQVMDELSTNNFVYDIENYELINSSEIKFVYLEEEEQ